MNPTVIRLVSPQSHCPHAGPALYGAEVAPDESIMLQCYGWPALLAARERPHKDQWRITFHDYFIKCAFEFPRELETITDGVTRVQIQRGEYLTSILLYFVIRESSATWSLQTFGSYGS